MQAIIPLCDTERLTGNVHSGQAASLRRDLSTPDDDSQQQFIITAMMVIFYEPRPTRCSLADAAES